MAYNRENLLKRIIKMQNIVLKHRKNDTPYKRIFEKHIKDQFDISYSTFNEWNGTNAKLQLEKLLAEKEKQKNLDKRQLELFKN